VFRKGDKVVYPQHGAVVIEDIVERDFDGARRTYLKLHVSIGDLTLMVPVESIEQVGLREVVSRKEITSVFGLLREEEVWLPMNWAKRYKANLSKLSSGDIYQLTELVRDLSCRERAVGISSSETTMLTKARRFLISELALSLDSAQEDAEVALDAVLAERFAHSIAPHESGP